jgi:hypothetical protein
LSGTPVARPRPQCADDGVLRRVLSDVDAAGDPDQRGSTRVRSSRTSRATVSPAHRVLPAVSSDGFPPRLTPGIFAATAATATASGPEETMAKRLTYRVSDRAQQERDHWSLDVLLQMKYYSGGVGFNSSRA